jgi:hypothetical protein
MKLFPKYPPLTFKLLIIMMLSFHGTAHEVFFGKVSVPLKLFPKYPPTDTDRPQPLSRLILLPKKKQVDKSGKLGGRYGEGMCGGGYFGNNIFAALCV